VREGLFTSGKIFSGKGKRISFRLVAYGHGMFCPFDNGTLNLAGRTRPASSYQREKSTCPRRGESSHCYSVT
jgi:hypothetical protein